MHQQNISHPCLLSAQLSSSQNTSYNLDTIKTSQDNCMETTTTTLNENQVHAARSTRLQDLKATETTTDAQFKMNEQIPRCDGRCFAERRIHCRELAKWGRPMLLTLVGLENVFQRALGPLQWRKYCKAVNATISNPKDFCSLEESHCDWCLNTRTAATGYDSCPTMNESLLNDDCVTIPRCSTVNSSALSCTSTSTTLTAASSVNNLTSTSSTSAAWNAQLLALSFINSMRQQNGENFPSNIPFSAFHPIISSCEQQHQFLPSVSSATTWNSQHLAHYFQNTIQNWNSQLLAFSFLNSLQQQNGFNLSSTFPFPSLYPIVPGSEQQHQNQFLPSSDAFFSFLEQKFQQRKYSPPTSQQIFTGINEALVSSQKINGDEQPLDLSAKSSALNDSTSKTCSPRFDISFLGASDDSHSTTENQPQRIRATSSNFNIVDNEIQGADNNASSNSGYRSGTEKIETNGFSNSNFLDDNNEAVLSNSKTVGLKKYSQADLDAAVLAIRNGRLGTRRASVVYGIPRSTLRNKIYKLEAADELLTNGLDFSINSRHKRLTAFALHKQERQRITTISPSSVTKLKNETTNKIRTKKNKFNDHEKNREENLCEKELSNEATSLNENVESLTVQQYQHLNNLIPSASTVLPIVNEICNNNVPVESITTETLFKEITSQLGHFVQSSGVSEFNNNNISSEQLPSNYCDIDIEKYHQDPFDPKLKGKRQKRGQYRKYNKDALDKAVLAVRSGQMSVHRAGSHFGVPHSTLEYKVKERNLLRIKSKKLEARKTHLQSNTSPEDNLHKDDSPTPLKE